MADDCFVALDFETANPSRHSICQIGVVEFEGDRIVRTFSTLVDPEDAFYPFHVRTHGIDEEKVRGAPTFRQIYPEICGLLSERTVITHTSFDVAALRQAEAKNDCANVRFGWIDTARVAQIAWPNYANTGFGLANLARDLGISFQHHDAAEDARVAGIILNLAMKVTGLGLEDWLHHLDLTDLDDYLILANTDHLTSTDVSPPSSNVGRRNYFENARRLNYPASVAREGDSNGHLFGEVVVFTGNLSIVRAAAADIAAKAGCRVDDALTKKTTILVLGQQDIRYLAEGQEKSGKHRKAEEWISKGHKLRILGEEEFLRACQHP